MTPLNNGLPLWIAKSGSAPYNAVSLGPKTTAVQAGAGTTNPIVRPASS